MAEATWGGYQHGTARGHRRHRTLLESPCDPCRVAWNEYTRASVRRSRARGWKRKSKTRYDLTCERCEVLFRSTDRRARFCSLSCHMFNRHGRPACRELVHIGPVVVEPKMTTAPLNIPRRIDWFVGFTAGPCSWCGDHFVSATTAFTDKYCSRACVRQSTKARRGRFAVPPQMRLSIYERDDFTCQLCFEPVDRAAHYQDDWAPSLDHIEPQSAALIPDHSPENLRTTHRWCNAVRGDGRWNRDFFEEVA